MSEVRHTRVAIVGSGPAGYTAAIYAARAMLSPVVFEGLEPGGQLTITTDVENYPGFAEVIQGPWLMEQMKGQAAHVGADLRADSVKRLDLQSQPFQLETENGERWSADAVILATGAKAKWLGLESETAYRGHGVSACATCDGFFFKGKRVMVVGGGNTAAEEALFLTNFATEVVLVHRRDSLRAEKILQERVFKNPKITVRWHTEVEEILGERDPFPKVTAVRLRNNQTSQTEETPMDGVFIAIGHAPAVDLVAGQLKLTPSGVIWVEPGTAHTSLPGVFAAGDVVDDRYRQAVTAAGLGCMAALDAESYLAEREARFQSAAE